MSESIESSPSSSSGTNSICLRMRWILWQMAEEQVLDAAPLIQRQIAAAEQVDRHVERLLRVVIALQHVARGEVLIRIQQVDERLLGVVGCSLRGHVVLALPGHAQHAEDQAAVIGHDGPAALGDDRRMLDARIVADAAARDRRRRWRIPAGCN